MSPFCLCFFFQYFACISCVAIMDSGLTVVTNPTVNVRLTSTISSFEVQQKLNRGITLANLKVRLILPYVIYYTTPDLHLILRCILCFQRSNHIFTLFFLIREGWRWLWAYLHLAWTWSCTVSLTSSCRKWMTTKLCWVPIPWMTTAEYMYVAAQIGHF